MFADDTNVNHAAGVKASYRLSQKDLTVLKAGQEDGRWNAILAQGQVSESVYTHTLNLHKSAHRLMSINQTLPLTIGALEFMWTMLWKYHQVLRRGHKRYVEDQEDMRTKTTKQSCITVLHVSLERWFRSPQKDRSEFESIQWRLTSRIRGAAQLPYEESSKLADSSMKKRQPWVTAWE